MNSGKSCLAQFVAMVIIFLSFFIVDQCNHTESALIKDARKGGRVGAYLNYIRENPNGKYIDEALDSIYSITINESYALVNLQSTYKMANKFPIKGSRIETPIKKFIYDNLLKANSEYYWKQYIEIADTNDIFDSKEQLANIQKQLWGTEILAWATASKQDEPYFYKEYLKHYPNGKHAHEAKKKYVSLCVNRDFSGEHGTLPAMEQTSKGGSSSTINIHNSTEYELTVMYSGPDHEYLTIPSGSIGALRISNGTYRISARVNDYKVRPFVGIENLSGGNYQVKYHITQY